jgi:hypothetical protein
MTEIIIAISLFCNVGSPIEVFNCQTELIECLIENRILSKMKYQSDKHLKDQIIFECVRKVRK